MKITIILVQEIVQNYLFRRYLNLLFALSVESVSITGAKEAVLGKDLPGKNHKETKLINLAYARSGDKGDHANIGIIARDPAFLPYIRYSLTIDRLKDYFCHVLRGDIQCWEV